MKEKMDPGTSSGLDGGGPVLSAWVAGECYRVLGQELAEEGGRLHAYLVRKAKGRESDAWDQPKVYSPLKMGPQSKDVGDTC